MRTEILWQGKSVRLDIIGNGFETFSVLPRGLGDEKKATEDGGKADEGHQADRS
jgi:hypothetical protein